MNRRFARRVSSRADRTLRPSGVDDTPPGCCLHLLRKFVIFSQVAARLDNRPLLGTSIDEDLFLRPKSMSRLERAVDRHLNVLLFGEPGSGKTSILRVLEARLERAGDRPAVYVDLGPATDARQALLLVSSALGEHDALSAWGDDLRAGLSPRIAASDHLLRLVRRLGERPSTTILADAPPRGGQAHVLFGRLRDELWRLDHNWVVAADTALRDELARPPADAFFDVRLELEPLAPEEQLDFLRRRLDDEPGIDVTALVGETDAWPRSLVGLAREAVLSDEPLGTMLARKQDFRRRLEGLPPAARTVAEYLSAHGAAAASDPQLLGALGFSAQRARQVFGQLEKADLVRSFADQQEGVGRPRKLYELAEPVAL